LSVRRFATTTGPILIGVAVFTVVAGVAAGPPAKDPAGSPVAAELLEDVDPFAEAGSTSDRSATAHATPLPPNLLRPLPERGGIGRIPGALPGLHPIHLGAGPGTRASREATDAIASIRRRFLGMRRDPELRARGLAMLREWRDPAAILVMHRLLRRERDDVRRAMLDHFESLGSAGQGGLAWIAIHDEDPALRGEAQRRLRRPADPAALAILDHAIRSTRHETVNRAGLLAGHLEAIAAIPHLIFAQVAADEVREEGDLAWIAIGSQISYVADLVPIVGNGVGAFQPIPGTIMEGVVLQVRDAVAISYRTDVHRALVAMTTDLHGVPTGDLGYDPAAWWRWFDGEFVPANLARAELEGAAP